VSSGIHVFHVPSAGLDRAEYYRHTYLRYTLIVCLHEQNVVRLDARLNVLYEYIYVRRRYVFLAPSISALQDLLHVCEVELAWLDISLNATKSMSMRIGPRHK